MRYAVVVLFLALLAGEALAKGPPTGNRLVRLVCHQYLSDGDERRLFGHVIVLEQLSSKTVNTETAFSDTIDGSVLIDPDDTLPTDVAAFRLRVYEAQLLPRRMANERSVIDRLSRMTGSQAVRDLLARNADLDAYGERMDYPGVGFQSSNQLIFQYRSPDYFKEVVISMKDLTGFMSSDLGASRMVEDGLYICGRPVLVPERAE